MKPISDYRGSRKHVLQWVEKPEFVSELNDLLEPTSAQIVANSEWMPRGPDAPREARLENLGSQYLPTEKRNELRAWWLKHQAGANTPNWDFLSPCLIDGQPGLVLIEAKANKKELSKSQKLLSSDASDRSRENHNHICAAIRDASNELSKLIPGVSLTADNHYQVANRIAFAWKLASMGIPVVLIYLGFTGDNGIRDAGEPFWDEDDWRSHFVGATKGIFPESAIGKRIECAAAPFWLLVESAPVFSESPPKPERKQPVHRNTLPPRP